MNASAAVETQLLDAAEQLLPELGRRRREIDELRHLPQDLADNSAVSAFHPRPFVNFARSWPPPTALRPGAFLLALPHSICSVRYQPPSCKKCCKTQT